MRYLFVLLALISLAGCARGYNREVRSFRINGDACRELGYRTGSEDWTDCTVELERARVAGVDGIKMPTADGKKEMTCTFVRKRFTKNITTCE